MKFERYVPGRGLDAINEGDECEDDEDGQVDAPTSTSVSATVQAPKTCAEAMDESLLEMTTLVSLCTCRSAGG